MAAIARMLERRIPAIRQNSLKTVGMFCGVGIFVSLLFAVYGLDLSLGFF